MATTFYWNTRARLRNALPNYLMYSPLMDEWCLKSFIMNSCIPSWVFPTVSQMTEAICFGSLMTKELATPNLDTCRVRNTHSPSLVARHQALSELSPAPIDVSYRILWAKRCTSVKIELTRIQPILGLDSPTWLNEHSYQFGCSSHYSDVGCRLEYLVDVSFPIGLFMFVVLSP